MTSKQRSGRVALVTGAAGGLGVAFVERLAQDGHDVVVTDIVDCAKAVAKVEAAGGRALAVKCDLTVPGDIEKLGKQAIAQFGRVDILVNNAAFLQGMVPFDAMTGDLMRQYLAVNVEAPFLLSKAVVPSMRERKWGRIVDIVSSSAWLPPPFMLGYVTSKMGLVGLTRAMASALASDGITVNCIAPSLTRTPATDQSPKEFWDATVATQMIRRPALPGDLTGALSFLCSDDAGFVTGQTLQVNGGQVV